MRLHRHQGQPNRDTERTPPHGPNVHLIPRKRQAGAGLAFAAEKQAEQQKGSRLSVP
jgi:hypothetical protein